MNPGEKIRKLRKEKQWTQAELSQRAGIAINTLRLYEGGKRKPQSKQLQLLADALNVPVSSLTDAEQLEEPSGMLQPKATRFYPREDGKAIFFMTLPDDSVYVGFDYPMVPMLEVIPWRMSQEDAQIVEFLVNAYLDKTGANQLPPEIGAGIKVMLDKFAERSNCS